MASRDPPKQDEDALWGKKKKFKKSVREKTVCRSFSTHVSGIKEEERPKRYSAPPSCDFNQHDLTDILSSTPVHVMAQQLTWIESKLFIKIKPRDFLRHVWGPKETPISALIDHFNYISAWVASMIVNQNRLEDRVFVYEYCLKIAVVGSMLKSNFSYEFFFFFF